jgi:hypothetical protein
VKRNRNTIELGNLNLYLLGLVRAELERNFVSLYL